MASTAGMPAAVSRTATLPSGSSLSPWAALWQAERMTRGTFRRCRLKPSFSDGDQVRLAVRLFKQQIAGVRRRLGRSLRFLVLEHLAGEHLREIDRAVVQPLRQAAVGVEHAVAIEVEDIHGWSLPVIDPRHQRVERRRAEEFPGDPPRSVRHQRVEHGGGIGPRVEKAGTLGPADDEEQVKPLLGLDLERLTPAGHAGQAAADADSRVLVEQECPASPRVTEQFPGEPKNCRRLGTDGEQASLIVGILEGVEEALRRAIAEGGVEQRLAPVRQPSGDAFRFLVVRVAERVCAVKFQIPPEFIAVLGGERVLEGQLPGLLAAEADDDPVVFHEAEAEFGAHGDHSP